MTKITKHAQVTKYLTKHPEICEHSGDVRRMAKKFNCTTKYVYSVRADLFGPKRGAKVETPVVKQYITKVSSNGSSETEMVPPKRVVTRYHVRQDELEEQMSNLDKRLSKQTKRLDLDVAKLFLDTAKLFAHIDEQTKRLDNHLEYLESQKSKIHALESKAEEEDKDMAITRAQLLKELIPGLNALFGMEYSKYGEEHEKIFEAAASPTTTRGDILDTAKQYITKDRAEEHGDLASNFTTIAAYWSTHLNTSVSVTDVAVMMNLVKVARIKSNPNNLDSWIDGCGYLACGGELVGGVR